jgi:protein-disulfide isomerase
MIVKIAESVNGLNVPKLLGDRNSSAVKQQIADVSASVLANNVNGTPTVFVGRNGTKPQLVGAPGSSPTQAEVEAAIDTALAG